MNVAGTRTRRHTMGLIPTNQTLTCRIASSPAAATAATDFSSDRGSFDRRFIQPDLPRQPETPQIVMLSAFRPELTNWPSGTHKGT